MGSNMKKSIFLSAVVLIANAAFALPFNSDMVDTQMKTGEVMRPKPLGSVPIGSLENRVTTADEAAALTNPHPDDAGSIENGGRLFKVNCSPCHGDIASRPYKKGLVAEAIIQNIGVDMNKPPDITIEMYRRPQMSDGTLYGRIHLGMGLMFPVGWKLSADEHWDIVNYVRKVQSDVAKVK